MKLLVLGASGGIGRWICSIAAERGHEVRALVRPGTPFDAPDGAEVMHGEVLDPDVLTEALVGRHAVLSAMGIKRRNVSPWSRIMSPLDLTTRVAEHLVALMPAHGIQRVVAVSAGGVRESMERVHPLFRWLIRLSNMSVSYADLAGMESVFEGSDLDWMAVRPTTLTNDRSQGKARAVEWYGLTSRVSRRAVAEWMLDAVESDEPFGFRTPMIVQV